MDRRLQLIAHLYEEDLEGLEPLDTLLEDPELRSEYRLLRESRFALDHRSRARPGTETIDAILREAAPRPGPERTWVDRPALRLVRSKRLLAPAIAVAAVLVVAIAIYPLMSSDRTDLTPRLAGKAEAGDRIAESSRQAVPPAAAAPYADADPAAAEQGEAADPATSLPAWDTSRDLRQLSRRIAALRAAGVDSWDSPAVPLEMPPSGPGPSDLVPAASGRERQ